MEKVDFGPLVKNMECASLPGQSVMAAGAMRVGGMGSGGMGRGGVGMSGLYFLLDRSREWKNTERARVT